jgi:hypothetical protein
VVILEQEDEKEPPENEEQEQEQEEEIQSEVPEEFMFAAEAVDMQENMMKVRCLTALPPCCHWAISGASAYLQCTSQVWLY